MSHFPPDDGAVPPDDQFPLGAPLDDGADGAADADDTNGEEDLLQMDEHLRRFWREQSAPRRPPKRVAGATRVEKRVSYAPDFARR